eukprot:gene12239-15379_t
MNIAAGDVAIEWRLVVDGVPTHHNGVHQTFSHCILGDEQPGAKQGVDPRIAFWDALVLNNEILSSSECSVRLPMKLGKLMEAAATVEGAEAYIELCAVGTVAYIELRAVGTEAYIELRAVGTETCIELRAVVKHSPGKSSITTVPSAWRFCTDDHGTEACIELRAVVKHSPGRSSITTVPSAWRFCTDKHVLNMGQLQLPAVPAPLHTPVPFSALWDVVETPSPGTLIKSASYSQAGKEALSALGVPSSATAAASSATAAASSATAAASSATVAASSATAAASSATAAASCTTAAASSACPIAHTRPLLCPLGCGRDPFTRHFNIVRILLTGWQGGVICLGSA